MATRTCEICKKDFSSKRAKKCCSQDCEKKRKSIINKTFHEKNKEKTQSKHIFTALKNNGVPIAYLSFDGENYRLRDPKNKATAIEAELSFYGTIFGFTPADDIPKLTLTKATNLNNE